MPFEDKQMENRPAPAEKKEEKKGAELDPPKGKHLTDMVKGGGENKQGGDTGSKEEKKP